ncbi:MAG: PfkB family carbohydrate kinase [Candidatus Levyibacteriota bacterium]
MNNPLFFASVGDLCLDIYPRYKKRFPGGTAFTTALHAAKAGAHANIFSAIGTDAAAQIFQEACKKYDIDSSCIKILHGKTSNIKVHINAEGQRTFSEWELEVLREYTLQSKDKKELEKYDVIKMTYFKPLNRLFNAFCQINQQNTLKVADFAGSSVYSENFLAIQQYINRLDIIIKSLETPDNTSLSFIRELSMQHKEKIILTLLGEKGSIAFFNGETYIQPAIKTKVIDTNGAGDAFIAHFLVTYLKKRDILPAMLEGSKAAAERISQVGLII